MVRIQKVDKRISRTAVGSSGLVMGVIIALIGGYFALAGFEVIPLNGKANAPLWVIGFVGLAFVGAGLMLGGGGIRGMVNRRLSRRHQAKFPNQPWIHDYPWQAGGKPVASRWQAGGERDHPWARSFDAVRGLLFFVVFIVPFNWWAFLSNSGPLPVKVLVGLLDIGLVIGAIVVIRRLLATLKYGHSQISFNRFPFFLGEKLDVTFSPVPFEIIDLTLRFVTERYEARGSGKNRSRQFIVIRLLDSDQFVLGVTGCLRQ